MAQAQPDRDKALIEDYNLKEEGEYKLSTTQLTMKYEISATRIYQILNKYGIAKRSVIKN